jgi:O-antigen/teichoic acid export membrane protein
VAAPPSPTNAATLPLGSALVPLFTGAGMLVLATTGAGATNYLVNLYLGRALGPAGFSEATLLVTFVLLTSILTTAIGLVLSRLTALHLVDADHQAVADVRDGARLGALLVGVLLAGLFVAFAGDLGQTFRMAPEPLMLLGLSLPVYLVLSVERGILLGQLRYARLGVTYVVEAVVRLGCSVVAVNLGLATLGIAGALALSFIAAWWVARAAASGLPTAHRLDRRSWRALAGATVAACAALLGQAILANGDIIFVKGAFAPESAGTFSAIALVGRAVYFATTAATTALFPVVAARARRGEPHRGLLLLVLAGVVVVCGGMTAVAWAAPEMVLGAFFGPTYAAGASLSGPYSLAISMLVGAGVIAMYRLALGRPGSGYLTLCAGIVLVAALVLVAETPATVVQVMIAVNAGLLLATAIEAGLLSGMAPSSLTRPRGRRASTT